MSMTSFSEFHSSSGEPAPVMNTVEAQHDTPDFYHKLAIVFTAMEQSI